MPDAQPKPTAADVLREHRWSAAIGGCYPPCIWHGDDAEDEQTRHAQHQADMLAAAGLLATPEHDEGDNGEASDLPTDEDVRVVYVAAQEVQHGVISAGWGRRFDRWLAEHDAQVARATKAADEAERRADRIAGGGAS